MGAEHRLRAKRRLAAGRPSAAAHGGEPLGAPVRRRGSGQGYRGRVGEHRAQAIDDFGVGYSSLTHLKRFPIDTLKVDRSFIRDLPQDLEDKAITEAIIAMGKSLNLTVVAEGVETLEQQTFLHDHACDEMQGFYFSKPIPGGEFAELLRKRIKG